MPAATKFDEGATVKELEDLLCAIVAGDPLNRAAATSYSDCRARLLGSTLRASLPGFLSQCMSLQRFKEFITLYHPDAQQRIQFVRQSFDSVWSLLGHEPRNPSARGRASGSRHWMM